MATIYHVRLSVSNKVRACTVIGTGASRRDPNYARTSLTDLARLLIPDHLTPVSLVSTAKGHGSTIRPHNWHANIFAHITVSSKYIFMHTYITIISVWVERPPEGAFLWCPCSTQTLGQSYNTRLSSSKFQAISKER